MRRWLLRFFLFSFLQLLRVDGPVWILFLRARGLSLAEVGLAEVAYHVAGLLGQLPSGVLADAFGRQWAMALGCAVAAAGSALMLGVHGVGLAVAALALYGLGAACVSGADRGLLYAALAAAGEDARYAAESGRLVALGDAADAGGNALGGALAGGSGLAAAIVARAGLLAVSAVVALGLGGRGPSVGAGLGEGGTPRADGVSARRVSARAVMEALAAPGLRWWTVYFAAYSALGTCAGLLAQVLFADRGLGVVGVGLALTGCSLCATAGGLLAGRVRTGVVVWGPGVIGLCMAVAAVGRPAAAVVAAVMLSALVGGLVYPRLDTAIQARVPEAVRATVLSAQSALFSLLMIGAFPAFGAALGRVGPVAYAALVPGFLAVAAVGWKVTERGRGISRR